MDTIDMDEAERHINLEFSYVEENNGTDVDKYQKAIKCDRDKHFGMTEETKEHFDYFLKHGIQTVCPD